MYVQVIYSILKGPPGLSACSISHAPLASLVPVHRRTRPATSTMPAQSIDIATVRAERGITHWCGLVSRGSGGRAIT